MSAANIAESLRDLSDLEQWQYEVVNAAAKYIDALEKEIDFLNRQLARELVP